MPVFLSVTVVVVVAPEAEEEAEALSGDRAMPASPVRSA